MGNLGWLKFVLSFVLLIGAIPLAAGAAERVAFEMAVEERGNEVTVAVQAEHVDDLYAFDLVLEADAGRLKLKEAISELAGFTVGPLVEGDHIRFAHTKIGGSPGLNGEAELAVFVFERVGGEPVAVLLKRAQLVNSQLDMTEYEPGSAIALKRSALWHDAVGHWAEAVIRAAMERGIVDGYEDGTFRPDRILTRAEFATMLVRVRELPTAPNSELAFADKEDIPAWARPSVAAAAEAGLIVGYEDGTFRADQPIRREEMAAIIVRAFGGATAREDRSNATAAAEGDQAGVNTAAEGDQAGVNTAAEGDQAGVNTAAEGDQAGVNTAAEGHPVADAVAGDERAHAPDHEGEPASGRAEGEANGGTGFADDGQISEWARPYVAAAVEAGIMNGRGGNRFAPLASSTRAEAVAVLARIPE